MKYNINKNKDLEITFGEDNPIQMGYLLQKSPSKLKNEFSEY
jgi:hypothetical protein